MSTNIFQKLGNSLLKDLKSKGKEPVRMIPKPSNSSKASSMRVRTRSENRLNPLMGKETKATEPRKIKKTAVSSSQADQE